MQNRTSLRNTQRVFGLGLIAWCLLLTPQWMEGALSQEAAPGADGDAEKELEARERDTDRQHFRQISSALDAYRKDHGGDWPDWLSDLVPKYLTDTNLLVSPTEIRTHRTADFGMDDPKIHSSYTYEFNATSAGQHLGGDVGADFTMKKWKAKQIELWGSAVPVVRCHLYSPVLNLTVSGDIIETGTMWETDPHTTELMKRLGVTNVPPGWRSLVLSVVDADGEAPVAGAEVRVQSSYQYGSLPVRSMTTDAKGEGVIPLPKENVSSLVVTVSKPGYVRQGAYFSEEEEVLKVLPRIELLKGVAIHGTVRTLSGQPVAKARVELKQPSGEEREPCVTDTEGKWSMDGFPAGFAALIFEIAHPEFHTLSVDVTSTNVVSVLARRVSVRGTVEDAETHRPVDEFGAVGGYEYFRTIRWDFANPLAGRGGKFQLQGGDLNPCAVRVQAKGYQPRACALAAGGEEAIDLKFELAKAVEVTGEVVLADGQPAANADVTLLLECGGITLGQGSFFATDGPATSADAQGRFVLPLDPDAHSVVAVHQKGFAMVELGKVRASRKITLQPWARLTVPAQARQRQGYFEAATVVTADVFLPAIFQSPHLGTISLDFDKFASRVSGDDGVIFSFVPPGHRVVWRSTMLDQTWGPSPENMCYNGVEVDAAPGDLTSLKSGQGHVSVAGKVVSQGVSDWGGFLGRLAFRPSAAAPEQEVFFTLHPQGRFRVDGLPAETSACTLSVYRPPILFGTAEVPKGQVAPASGETDLRQVGAIELKCVSPVPVSETAVDFEMKCTDNKVLKLSSLRGKHVLLDFWTTWSGAASGSYPYLAAAQEKYGREGRLVVLSVNLDRDPRLFDSWVAWKQPSWRQAIVGDWMRTPILAQYGATGLASACLIDPDGRLLARDLWGAQIEAAVRQALK